MTASEHEIITLRHEILDELRVILVERLRVSLAPEQIDPDTMLFGSGLGLDSVDAVDLAVEIERRRKVRVGDTPESRQALRTIGTLVDVLLRHALTTGESGETGDPGEPTPATPLRFAADDPSPVAQDCEALRRRVALCVSPDIRRIRVRGSAAFDLIDRLSTRDVFVRSGQILHTLFLDAQGCAWADVHIAADDDDFLLFIEGPNQAELLTYLRDAIAPGESVEIIDLEPTHALLELSGPFAWELMERLVGPEVLGIPYLNFFDLPELQGAEKSLAFRMGKTGEYAYQLLIPRASMMLAIARLHSLGEAFGLREVGDRATDLCAIETGFFCAREPALRQLTPIELQLQWRISVEREVPGMDALRARRAAGAGKQIRWFRAIDARTPAPGATLWRGGSKVGEVLLAHHSAAAGVHVGIALLEPGWSEPDLELADADGNALLITAVAPLVRSLSLYVDPQRHTYATREADGLLGLV
jgi:glycine cleavage system aminomethyltransferase T/acyl carrier protein